MPVVDSAHIKHISIGVSDTNGRIDTLTFNIVINTTNEQTIIDKRDFAEWLKTVIFQLINNLLSINIYFTKRCIND